MKHMSLPNYLWGEAVRHSTYVINHVAIRTLKDVTPYESYKGNKPNVQHLRVFGCVCYARNEAPYLKKLDDRSRALVHLGTEPGSKAYRLYDPATRKTIVSRDVIFCEDMKWKWDKSEKEHETGSGEIILGPQANNEDEEESSCSEETVEDGDCSDENNEEPEDQAVLRRSTRQSQLFK